MTAFLLATVFIVGPKPVQAEQVIESSRNTRLTLEVQNLGILDVFKILAKRAGINIVAGRNVQGQVSIFLQDVPVMDALQTILQSQGPRKRGRKWNYQSHDGR